MMHPKLWRQYHGPQTRQHLNQSFRQQYLLVMATVSVKRFRASTIIPFALAAATGGLVGCLAVEPTGPSEVPVGSVPDPTLLPVARGQVPHLVAYLALNLPGGSAARRWGSRTLRTSVSRPRGRDGISRTRTTSGSSDWRTRKRRLPGTVRPTSCSPIPNRG